MVWFKVDDKLHDHRKIRQAGVAAMGLWVLAGSWSSDNLTDGFVPETVLRRWEHNYRRLSEKLVSANLWSAETVEGEPGYRFHNWGERQPTSSDVEERRSEARQRMAEMRAEKKARAESVRANIENGSQDVRSTPTRPDPSLKEKELQHSSSKSVARGTRLPLDWQPTAEQIQWVRSECPTVDGRAETENFKDYWIAKSGKDATKFEWPATYRRWMREAAKRSPPLRSVTARPSTTDQRINDGRDVIRRLAEQEHIEEQRQIGAS